MKTALCTISTKSHILKSKALYNSVLQFFEGDFCCLVTVSATMSWANDAIFHDLDVLKSIGEFEVTKKYKGDKLRWALKPIYLKYLLLQGYEKVIYVDNDIYFFNSPNHLFEKLNSSTILLTPHFYPYNPTSNQNWLEANYRVGLYNAGFIGVNQNAIPVLDWWRDCCLYNVKKSFWRGLFDDQKYLDLVPVIFDNVEVIKDTGCNLAGWNFENRLNILKEPSLETITFVHFAELTLNKFSDINSPFHKLYIQYAEKFLDFDNPLIIKPSRWSKRNIFSYIYYILWKLARIFD
jgi:hypothetical protein